MRIERLQLEDIPVVAKQAADAFTNDRQTQMKALGEKEPFDMEKEALGSMPGYLESLTCHVLKAVDEETGEIMGVCNWGIRGLAPKTLPCFEDRIPRLEAKVKDEEAKRAEEQKQQANNEHKPAEDVPKTEEGAQPEETDPIKRLVARTDADMNAWMKEVMPAGTACLFIVGLTVAPQFQGRGVGSALLRWGTKVCDDNNCFAWVHSSDPAWGMYQKSGFEVIRSLDIDLDEYAPCPPPGEGPDAKWGHYVFRYMKYFPRK